MNDLQKYIEIYTKYSELEPTIMKWLIGIGLSTGVILLLVARIGDRTGYGTMGDLTRVVSMWLCVVAIVGILGIHFYCDYQRDQAELGVIRELSKNTEDLTINLEDYQIGQCSLFEDCIQLKSLSDEDIITLEDSQLKSFDSSKEFKVITPKVSNDIAIKLFNADLQHTIQESTKVSQ